MQLYELTVVLASDEAKTKAIVEKLEKTIKEASGKVVEKNEWGKKTLSYPIKKNLEGVYIFYQLELEEPRVGGFARLLDNDDSVLRHLLLRAEKPSKKTVKSVKKVETIKIETRAEEKAVKILKSEDNSDTKKSTKRKGKKS